MKLSDPWYEAEFIGDIKENDSFSRRRGLVTFLQTDTMLHRYS